MWQLEGNPAVAQGCPATMTRPLCPYLFEVTTLPPEVQGGECLLWDWKWTNTNLISRGLEYSLKWLLFSFPLILFCNYSFTLFLFLTLLQMSPFPFPLCPPPPSPHPPSLWPSPTLSITLCPLILFKSYFLKRKVKLSDMNGWRCIEAECPTCQGLMLIPILLVLIKYHPSAHITKVRYFRECDLSVAIWLPIPDLVSLNFL